MDAKGDALSEQVAQNATPFCFLRLASGIELLAQIACAGASCHELRIERVVHFARHHLPAFSRHHREPITSNVSNVRDVPGSYEERSDATDGRLPRNSPS